MSNQFLTIVDVAMYVDTHNPESAVYAPLSTRSITGFTIIAALSTPSCCFSSRISIYRPTSRISIYGPFRFRNVNYARSIYRIPQVQIERVPPKMI
jgi:hypothetical protein